MKLVRAGKWGFALAALTLTAPPDASMGHAQGANFKTVEDYGAKGDGLADDSGALVKAVYSLGSSGGIIHLSCGKNYLIGSSITLAAPGVTVEGCWHRPAPPLDNLSSMDDRFLGNINTVGKLVRAPNATISIGADTGLKDVGIIQQGLTIPMPDTAAYSGTAIALAPGGNGSAGRLEDVLIVGATQCFDGRNGGNHLHLQHVIEDCTNGNYFGTSGGGSIIDDVQTGVFATQDFSGYPIASVAGNGITTTVAFIYPPTVQRPEKFTVGDLITLPDVSSSRGRLYPSVYGFKITASSQRGRSGTVQFASPVNTEKTPVTKTGRLTEYTKTFLRAGTANYWAAGCDDTHIGTLSEFGYAIGYDFQCHGIFNVGHLWADNASNIGIRIGSPSSSVAQAHFGSITIAGRGAIGLQVNAAAFARTTVMVDELSVIGISSDCAQLSSGATLQFGAAYVGGCSSFGFKVGAGAKLFGNSLDATVSTIGKQLLFPGTPAENVQIAHISTDGSVGASIYGGLRRPTMLASAPTLNLPISALDGTVETYAVSGSTTIASVNACWGDRVVRLIFTGDAKLAPGGNIAFTAGGKPGTVVTMICDSSTTPSSPLWRKS